MTRTALLAMDLHVSLVERLPGEYLPHAVAALSTARAAEIPVIHVALRLRPGHIDVHPHNKMFSALPAGAFTEDDPGTALHPEVAPRDGEIVVYKNRVSAFSGNNLPQILAAQGIGNLVLAGIATSGIVLSTVVQAADLDYGVTVLSDACGDPDTAVHDMLTTQVFPRRGEVLTTDGWAASLGVTP
ncbi:cysteine hydrolase [Amycolatopsis pithecellobii]|uniref:Isochorismatase family protein n=1 Tax=Amycolatopsis pithecellobii TaxID=664692 RepID=A0A6N7YMT0_9PSEU|nr:cysteine hydrolase [Amycolatopsis pithecellobii]MTD53322.1 isochorismatase family protein [Amycolatopsis pithecellobii]